MNYKIAKLTDLSSPKQWKTLSTEQLISKGFPVYGANGKIGFYSEYNHEEPTLMITCRGATCGSINLSEPKSWINGNAMCIDDLSEDLDVNYLRYYLLNYDFTNVISGSAQPQITRENLRKVKVKYYEIETQKQIAATLDKVTKIISENKKLLEKYDLLIKSRFIEMFGDPVINPMGWEVKKLGDTGTCKNGMNFHYDENGVELNCLGVGDFKDYSIIKECEKLPIVSLNELPSDEYLLENEDLVFVRSNGNKDLVGRCVAVYPNDLKTTFSGFCIRFRQSKNTFITEYLLRTLKTESMRKRMAGRGANIQNLNQQILTNLDVPVPPLELQQQFAVFVQQIDKSKFEI